MSEETELNEDSNDKEMGTPELINKSVIKATVILNKLGQYPQGITVTELAHDVHMSRPTTFRLLYSLEQTGFVERYDNKYMLGWKIARLGRLADPHSGIVNLIQPMVQEFANHLNELISYAVVNGEGDFDLILEVSGSRWYALQSGIKQDLPLHASVTGKVILAELSDDKVESLLPEKLPALASRTIKDRGEFIRHLQQVRVQEFAIIDDELEDGLFGVGIAVRDHTGKLIGVLAAAGPKQRILSQSIVHIVSQLQNLAKEIVEKIEQA
ncbi:IclR family transcriptional regulator [Acinetobacter sp. S40]|uniref:IclR family transcriptional regulator n=1 Tax=Acinetobacter sp. S40 TaxID=2767434 RepID=UPI00190ABB11|nr:IclR family transcriptional regulator [Acinetobacter sp. S40]MBJ9985859.1 IclR family transcriptional regulator [Acinetobacter sp. S40]